MTLVTQVMPEDLQRELEEPGELFILDLRNEEEFAQWQIEGRQPVTMLNIPYFLFLEDWEESVRLLPKDRPLTLVCGKGGASGYVAEMLAENGYQTRNLVGGLNAWSALQVPRVVKTEERDGLLLMQIARVGRGCLSYMVASRGEALVIDIGRDTRTVRAEAQARGLTIKGVIDTHLHADHISGGRQLSELIGAPYYLPTDDAAEVAFAYNPLTAGQMLTIGDAQVRALQSPGHTEGSISILVNDRYLLTGDTLFVHSVGRPDLGGKSHELVHHLYDTLFERYAALGDDVELYPAHYSKPAEWNPQGICSMTLGCARREHDALQIKERERFVAHVLGDMPAPPANFTQIRLINMGKLSLSESEARELESGPNRCAANK